VKALPCFEVDDAHRSLTTPKVGEAVRTIRKEELAAKTQLGPTPAARRPATKVVAVGPTSHRSRSRVGGGEVKREGRGESQQEGSRSGGTTWSRPTLAQPKLTRPDLGIPIGA
jgi:hypothetical protein